MSARASWALLRPKSEQLAKATCTLIFARRDTAFCTHDEGCFCVCGCGAGRSPLGLSAEYMHAKKETHIPS